MQAEPASSEQPIARDSFRQLFRDVARKCDLPPLSKVTARALALLRAPKTSTKDITRVVAGDGALAARVLKIARSAAYARQEPPSTLEEAITTVGFEELRQMLLVASARSLYRVDDEVAGVLWAHALATALAADELARLEGEPRGGSAFIAGLLHDIGRLVLHLANPVAYARLPHCDPGLEKELYGVGHAAVGGCLADMWGLSSDVSRAIVTHHVRPVVGLAERVALGDWIAHRIGCGSVTGDIPSVQTLQRVSFDLEAVAESVGRTFEVERTYFD